MNPRTSLAFIVLIFLTSGCLSEDPELDEKGLEVEELVELDNPWGIDFVTESEALVTEQSGELALVNVEDQSLDYFNGVPDVADVGQGGLLDVEYSDEEVFLTYSDSNGDGYATHLGKAEIDFESLELNNFEVLEVAEPFQSGGQHFGSRVIVDGDYVYFTSGDRGDKNFDDHVSQQTDNELGATLRVYRNGSVPESNPFTDNEEFVDTIYSYGHRNSQGMTMHNGEIWQSEHGEEDGDEINIIEKGGNHGWPETHTGCEYGTERPVGERPEDREEIINPVYYWECGTGGFPPAGMTFYTGEELEEFQDNLFIGNLAGRYLGRFTVENGEVTEEDPILEGMRIRDVEEGPDENLYVLADGSDAPLLRLGE